MVDINVIDESFELKNTSEYHLSIQAGLDGFSFCILDIHRNKYIAFRHIPLIVGKIQFLARKIETIFEHEEILNATFNSISIGFSTNKATLVPKEFSEPSINIKIADLTSNLSRNEETGAHPLPGFNYQIVYSYPKELMALFNRKFTDFRFCHKSVPMLASVITQYNEKRNTLVIDFEKKYIRMIALKGAEISLYNSFYYKNESDFLYYILNVCHSLLIDPERDEILISGYIASDSGFIRQLKKYLGNVQLLKPSADYSYGTLFEKVQKHQFISLLNTYPCA